MTQNPIALRLVHKDDEAQEPLRLIMEGTDAQPIGVDTPHINPCCELTVYRELERTLLASDELPGASPL